MVWKEDSNVGEGIPVMWEVVERLGGRLVLCVREEGWQ